MTTENVKDRLKYLREQIRGERISYGELAELQGLAEHIDPGDVELLEWAGVPEQDEPRYSIVDTAVIDGTIHGALTYSDTCTRSHIGKVMGPLMGLADDEEGIVAWGTYEHLLPLCNALNGREQA